MKHRDNTWASFLKKEKNLFWFPGKHEGIGSRNIYLNIIGLPME